jgi:type I restriction enzyme S subunit
MDFKTFLENFDAIAEAPGGIPKLRSLILDLAVQGKLVPQNLEDESASKLLERLKVERKKLIEEKKFRKSDLVEIANTKELFHEIPKSWEWARIGSFALVKGGKRLPQGSSFSVHPTSYIYIQVTNMKDGTITQDGLKYIDEETYLKISHYTIEKDDLYISIAGTIGEVGEVPAFFHQMNLTENAAKIVFRGLDKHYFKLALQSNVIQDQFKDKTNKQAQPKLALKRIADTVIPIPPKDEQGRIVAKVNELMGLCDRYEVAKQTRDNLRQQLKGSAITSLMNAETDEDLDAAWAIVRDNWQNFSQHLGDVDSLQKLISQLAIKGKLVPQHSIDKPASELIEKVRSEKVQLVKEKKIPKPTKLEPIKGSNLPYTLLHSWSWVRLGEISKFIEYGTSEKASEIQDDVPVFRMNNIQNGKLVFKNFKYVSASIRDLPKLYLQDGDLLFNRTNSYELVGKTGVFRGESNRYTFASYLIRITLFLKYVNPEFINLVINSAYFRQAQIEPEIVQQCGQANFNGTKLQNTLIPLPPLAEQKRIVAKVDELMQLCDQLEASLRQSQQGAESLAASAINHLTI